MEELKLTRSEYSDAIERIGEAAASGAYLDRFAFEFPEGLNTASSLEICRAVEDSSLESKLRITRICIEGKPVAVTCPNGEKERFKISGAGDSLDGFELFRKEPLALTALCDTVYGHILKKSLRLSKAPEDKPQTSSQ